MRTLHVHLPRVASTETMAFTPATWHATLRVRSKPLLFGWGLAMTIRHVSPQRLRRVEGVICHCTPLDFAAAVAVRLSTHSVRRGVVAVRP